MTSICRRWSVCEGYWAVHPIVYWVIYRMKVLILRNRFSDFYPKTEMSWIHVKTADPGDKYLCMLLCDTCVSGPCGKKDSCPLKGGPWDPGFRFLWHILLNDQLSKLNFRKQTLSYYFSRNYKWKCDWQWSDCDVKEEFVKIKFLCLISRCFLRQAGNCVAVTQADGDNMFTGSNKGHPHRPDTTYKNTITTILLCFLRGAVDLYCCQTEVSSVSLLSFYSAFLL